MNWREKENKKLNEKYEEDSFMAANFISSQLINGKTWKENFFN